MTELWDANHNVGETPDLVPYLRLDESIVVIPEWLSLFLTFIVLFNNFIPISLYVTIEFVNYIQAMLIEKDREMYDEETCKLSWCLHLCWVDGSLFLLPPPCAAQPHRRKLARPI